MPNTKLFRGKLRRITNYLEGRSRRKALSFFHEVINVISVLIDQPGTVGYPGKYQSRGRYKALASSSSILTSGLVFSGIALGIRLVL